jgi:hypothetical protein
MQEERGDVQNFLRKSRAVAVAISSISGLSTSSRYPSEAVPAERLTSGAARLAR